MREFETGATRDVVEGKLSYIKGLSPIVLRRYLEYLNLHRKQSDGNMREFDNWKKGIEQDVYLDSLGRHNMDVWLLCHNYLTEDNHGPVDLESALCGIIFNSTGMLHEILEKKVKKLENIDRVVGFIFPRCGFTKEAEYYCKERGIACSEDERWLES